MVTRMLGQWRLRRRLTRAILPEAGAISLAESNGFKVVETLARRDLRFIVKENPVRIEVRADLVITKGGRRYAAKIHGSVDDVDPASAGIRQMVLEFREAYRVDGVALLDGKKVLLIEFERRYRRTLLLPIIFAMGVGALLEAKFRAGTAIARFVDFFFLNP